MVIKCIDGSVGTQTTTGKRYKVVTSNRNTYLIVNDNDSYRSIKKDKFTKCHWLWNLFV